MHLLDESDFDAAGRTHLVPGLTYRPAYISESLHERLLAAIDMQEWSRDLQRRVQHYGYRYDYGRGHQLSRLGPLPPWAAKIARKLFGDSIVPELPDQVIVNEYLPGQGITPHIDDPRRFEETIASLSLGSPTIMDFLSCKTRERLALLLKPRSLLVLQRESRYDWKHGIAHRKSDIINGVKTPRGRRVSLTFRKVIAQSEEDIHGNSSE